MYIHKELISILSFILIIVTLILVRYYFDFKKLNKDVKGLKKKPLSAKNYFFFNQFEPLIFNLNTFLTRVNSKLKHNKRQISFYDKFFNSFPDPLFIIDDINQIVELNDSAIKLVGPDARLNNINSILRIPNLGDLIKKSNQTKKPQTEVLNLVYPTETVYNVWVSSGSRIGKGYLNFIRLYDCTSEKKVQELQSDFVANVSHELKTPVSAIVGYCETLQGIGKNDEKIKTKFLNILKDESLRMSSLVNDLLSLTRIERIEHSRPESSVDLSDLMRDVIDISSGLIKNKNLIKSNIPSRKISIIGDYNELKQVFINIVDNALKYGASKKPIEIKVQAKKDFAFVTVKDFGKGINEADIPMLTNRFYRVDSSRSRDLGSTGLGLSIVKHILSRHKTELEIESKANEGSTFSIKFPYN